MMEFTLEKLIPIAGERLDFIEYLQIYKEKIQKQVRIQCILVNVRQQTRMNSLMARLELDTVLHM